MCVSARALPAPLHPPPTPHPPCHCARQHDETRLNEFLSAASRGSTARVREMLEQGFDANSADYGGRGCGVVMAVVHVAHSRWPAALGPLLAPPPPLPSRPPPSTLTADGRSALMLACVKGYAETAELLLSAGADPNAKDAFSGTAM